MTILIDTGPRLATAPVIPAIANGRTMPGPHFGDATVELNRCYTLVLRRMPREGAKWNLYGLWSWIAELTHWSALRESMVRGAERQFTGKRDTVGEKL